MSREHLGQFAIAGNMGFTRGILLLDDCEGTLAWDVSGTGADWVGAYATAAAWVGTNGLHLATRTTDPADNDIVRAFRVLEWSESGVLAMRMWFASPDISVVKKVMFKVERDDGTHIYQAEIEYLPGTEKVQYVTTDEAWIESTIDPGTVADLQWSMVEIVVDLTLLEWVTLRIFGQKQDLSGVAMWYNANQGSVKGVKVGMDVIASGANIATGYFDQIYVGEHVDL